LPAGFYLHVDDKQAPVHLNTPTLPSGLPPEKTLLFAQSANATHLYQAVSL
jgi:hypothetical protein